jgi:sugar lactone lactonase YvrE
VVVVAPARWRIIDPDIANTNGPAVGVIDGSMTLIIGDPSAVYFSYPCDPTTGTVGVRSVFGDTSGLEGMPDGSTLDVDGGPVVRARRRRPVGPASPAAAWTAPSSCRSRAPPT